MKRVFPTICPHCVKFVHPAPVWLVILYALYGKVSTNSFTSGTAKELAERLSLPVDRVRRMIGEAKKHGALEISWKPVPRYRKSRTGKQLLNSWLRAGWPHSKGGTQAEARAK